MPASRVNSAAISRSGQSGRAERITAVYRSGRGDGMTMPTTTSMRILTRSREARSPERRLSTASTATARLRPLAIPASRMSPCGADVSDESKTVATASKETQRKETKSTAEVPADTLQHSRMFDRVRQIGARDARLQSVSAATDVINDEYKVNHYPSTNAPKGDWTNSGFGRMPLQFNRKSLTRVETDKHVYLQSFMGSGPYAAHAY